MVQVAGVGEVVCRVLELLPATATPTATDTSASAGAHRGLVGQETIIHVTEASTSPALTVRLVQNSQVGACVSV